MVADFPRDYYVYLDLRSPIARIHVTDCPSFHKIKSQVHPSLRESPRPGSVFGRQLKEGALDRWMGPFEEMDDAAKADRSAKGERKVLICRLCRDMNSCVKGPYDSEDYYHYRGGGDYFPIPGYRIRARQR